MVRNSHTRVLDHLDHMADHAAAFPTCAAATAAEVAARHTHPHVKKRLERLAKGTGRTGSFLAAEAIKEYFKVAGIKRALASLDRREGIPHDWVTYWVASWGQREREANLPRSTRNG